MLERRQLLGWLAAPALAGPGSLMGPIGAARAAAQSRPWQDQGEAAASNSAALNADPARWLRHAGAADYRVTSFQQWEGLAPGSYTLWARSRSAGGQASCFAFARVAGHSLARTSLSWQPGEHSLCLPGIPVGEDGRLMLGLHSEAQAGQWAELGEIRLQRETRHRPLLAGGDVSVLHWMERQGARYSDRRGRPGDALKILREHGHSIVRLRLYESPGKGHGVDGWYWPAGCMDLADQLALARRAQALGQQIQLTLHYSDFWTNGKTQALPKAWADQLAALPDEAARMDRLEALVARRTREVLAAFQAQGTPPQFVSLGNEIEAGLLFPYGRADAQGWPRLARLLRAGQAAVREVAPQAKVVLHLDDGGNLDKYRWWFDQARALGVDWDVIGCSYYPFWTRKTVAELAQFCTDVSARYDRDVLVMEAGFNFAPRRPGGWPGQLADNGPYPESMSSPLGQRQFVDELLHALKQQPRVLGLLYWDPIMIETPGTGWALRESDDQPGDNVVSNTTLFDFQGRALPALDAWRDHVPAMPLPSSPAKT